MNTKAQKKSVPRLRQLSSRELELELLQRAIQRTDAAIETTEATLEALNLKLRRRRAELRRQLRLHAIARKQTL